MRIKRIIYRIYNLLFFPKKEWKRIKKEFDFKLYNWLYFTSPLIILLGASSFAGNYYIAQRFTLEQSLFLAFEDMFSIVIALLLTGQIVAHYTKKYGCQSKRRAIVNLVFYSSMAILIGLSISKLHFTMAFFKLMGLFSIFTFWYGVEVICNVKNDHKIMLGITYAFSILVFFYGLKLIFVPVFRLI